MLYIVLSVFMVAQLAAFAYMCYTHQRLLSKILASQVTSNARDYLALTDKDFKKKVISDVPTDAGYPLEY